MGGGGGGGNVICGCNSTESLQAGPSLLGCTCSAVDDATPEAALGSSRLSSSLTQATQKKKSKA